MNLTSTPVRIIRKDSNSLEKNLCLSIVDNWAQVYRMDATEVSDKLLDYLISYSVPVLIVSTMDKNSTIKSFFKPFKHVELSTQHLPSNRLCERFHSTSIEYIRVLNSLYKIW